MESRLKELHGWVLRKSELLTVILSGGLIALAWLFRWLGKNSAGFYRLMLVGAIIAGVQVAREAWGRLMAGQFSIPLLVTIAAAGAIWIGEIWEAAAVTFLYVLGGYLESLTLARTREALRGLVGMAPRIARVKRVNEAGYTSEEIVVIPAEEVEAGEIVIVLPGDKVPVDGKVVSGRASLDTAALTGEPLPIEVGKGDDVLGGSVSMAGHIEVVAERVGPDTTFSKLVYLVAEAQEQKPKVQKMLDRFARWYTPLVISAAAVLYLLTKEAELALTFLVIGCPGALVVASPVAVVAGLGKAARQGILIKGGERLERIGKVDVVAFDKTGTLTLGRPRVSTIVAFAEIGSAGTAGLATAVEVQYDTGPSGHWVEKDIVAYAAAAELRSEHHLATAILAYAREHDISPVPATDWVLEPGLGATAVSEQGEILVGNRKLLESRNVNMSGQEQAVIRGLEARGQTTALVAVGGNAVGVIGIEDPIRPEAYGLIESLHKVGIKKTMMLTGDNLGSADRVAKELGIDYVRAGLLPQEKVDAIKQLQSQGHVVAMVGDGINDAPALAVADVSIAMGTSGTQAAIETADIALMTDRLERVPYSIDLSRKILNVVRQNVVFAVAVVLLLLAGVVGRVVFLSGGMLVHEASVLLVIANGMRLMKDRSLSGRNQTV